jgi:hypothetical protein
MSELRITVDRARLVGFLTWLVATPGLRVLHLRVIGAPYTHDRLGQVEKMLLGRLFLQTAPHIESLAISGIDTKTVLLSAVCRCVSLREFDLGNYSPDSPAGEPPSTLTLYLFLILCLVNRAQLARVRLPFTEEQALSVDVPDGKGLQEAVESTWATLWPSYRAGAKEAAANLPADATEMADMFAKMAVGMDGIESGMRATLMELRRKTPTFGAGERTVRGVLKAVFPDLHVSYSPCASDDSS